MQTNRFQNTDFRNFRLTILDFRLQISDCSHRNLSEGCPKDSSSFAFGIWFLLFGICLTGCVSQPSRTYGKLTVTTYAELTLLYEKKKMVSKQNDSSYQITLKDFFAQKGLQEEEFKKKIADLSHNSEVWKLFIQDVSTTMDSLKAIGK